jgi:hypothetical protein
MYFLSAHFHLKIAALAKLARLSAIAFHRLIIWFASGSERGEGSGTVEVVGTAV